MSSATPISASSRRLFLTQAAGLATAAAVPYFSTTNPATAQQKVPATEKLTLGIIGIGPRCIYDLKSILAFDDVQCVAIADVQQTRRQAGKQLVDGHYGNNETHCRRNSRG